MCKNVQLAVELETMESGKARQRIKVAR